MNVAGLDLSLARTGVAVEGRTFVIEGRGSGPARLAAIRRELNRAIQPADLDLAVVEGYPFGVNVAGQRSLAELHGVVMLLLWDLGIPFVRVNPTHVKLFATGNGHAPKDAMVAAARVRWPLQVFEYDDEADAAWLREIGMAARGDRPLTEWQRDVLGKIAWEAGVQRRAAMRTGG